MTEKNLVVGDADSLIALFLYYDANNKLATSTLKKLNDAGTTIIYPNTAIAEAITTLLRRHSNPNLASYVVSQYRNNRFTVEYIGEEIMKLATDIFNPKGSKQNTFFDAIVAACAKTLSVDFVFSFDDWYSKLGFKLASEVVY